MARPLIFSMKDLVDMIDKRRNNQFDVNIAVSGARGCLSKDTIIYGQTKTLEQLYKDGKRFINTISNIPNTNKSGGWRLKKSKSEIIPSGEKEVYEIEFEDGRKVFATEEHKFFKKDKHSFKETLVKNLVVGDYLKYFPPERINFFYNKWRDDAKIKRDKKHNNFKECSKCKNLFYTPLGKIRPTTYCKNCINSKNDDREVFFNKIWYEWEDNLIRQFYSDKPKKYITRLLPNRSWSAIMHRAKRINIKRSLDYKINKKFYFKKGKDNIMNNPKIKEKAMIKQIPIYAKNKMTSIEKSVANILNELNVKYEFNKVIRTKSTFRFPDFKIGNLLIECDGIYWHKQRKNDEEREKELKEMGYEIIRFTDKEIKSNLEGVKRCIFQRLNL